VNENVLVEFDQNGNVVSMTLEHAKNIANINDPIPLKFGVTKDIIEYVSDDFDEPLTEEFKECM
jgi:uncharacterized protein YuzE